MKNNKFIIYIAVVVCFFVLSTGCGTPESDQSSTSTTFDIVINDGNLVGDVDTLRIKKNEDVTLNFASDSLKLRFICMDMTLKEQFHRQMLLSWHSKRMPLGGLW